MKLKIIFTEDAQSLQRHIFLKEKLKERFHCNDVMSVNVKCILQDLNVVLWVVVILHMKQIIIPKFIFAGKFLLHQSKPFSSKCSDSNIEIQKAKTS